ncbi:MAG: PilZ domain-containing protein [Bryobacteraceae bacterium]
MPLKPSNRRSEPRVTQAGDILLSFDDALHRDIHAHLVDISNNGFRAAYGYPALSPGQLVAFQHATARGTARVIWTRIIGARIESGFLAI